jgi:hypothetical protein
MVRGRNRNDGRKKYWCVELSFLTIGKSDCNKKGIENVVHDMNFSTINFKISQKVTEAVITEHQIHPKIPSSVSAICYVDSTAFVVLPRNAS